MIKNIKSTNRIVCLKNLIIITLLFVLGFVLIREKYVSRIFDRLTREKYIHTYDKNINFKRELELYENYKKKGKVVMLGNSITYQCRWNELLQRHDIINQGIGADVTDGFLQRMKYVYKTEPKVCFIMGGINDLFGNISSIKINYNIEKIIDTLQSKNIEPIIYSILFVSKKYEENHPTLNMRVKETNKLLKQTCLNKGIDYIDLNKFMGNDDYLREEYSYDGLHINGKGYKKWGEIILPIIKKKVDKDTI
ncbi:hypothetical protein APS56_04670 [Pseudalgibacter alginicilyticus]|uniref:SGNH hydrolase-type esterase domain-containing protein n=1 Tax=Pseudalgibacter alginicilyticus TaxID=1736674 RepID=A0A0P0CED3_9FLAO|nr:GDSL-type esterase/lipase family protein [Pseudalgibacter alginicilyticus]ALJ04475.1 hypothetical protein APS56_04670 [Pseudalgibacter alginicilyticus]